MIATGAQIALQPQTATTTARTAAIAKPTRSETMP